MKKKGQTATEYLIILAVVIIIALIAIGVLSGIPGIGGGAQRSTMSSYWETSEIGVTSISIGKANQLIDGVRYNASGLVILRNNKANTIIVENVTLKDVSSNHIDYFDTKVTMTAGQSSRFNFSNLSNSGTSGEQFSYILEVFFADPLTGARYKFTGDGNTLVGTIAEDVRN